ncbi:MAG: carboxypeptidase regulatory-like domain-containing protein [Vicinamibacterales bacterium]
MKIVLRRLAAAVVLLLCAGAHPFAQQTGTLTGVVRDAQGGVLPGVSVSVAGEALIGGPRTAVTGEAGTYQLPTLPPGTYVVTYELSGFAPLKRDGIVVQVARTTRLDIELGVGTLQETVTVSGASPVVDVSSTVTQTNITKDLFEAIPTGRNPWVMAGLVPGVVTGRLDVGGTEGMQQYNLEAFGSANSQKSFSIDGLKTNWAGGDGGATMMYYGFEMYEEYNMQTASGTAESDVSGVYMNMVTKSGGNRFTSDHNIYFMNDALQGGNVLGDDALRQRLGLLPESQCAGAGSGTVGCETGAAGNPVDISYDWSSTLGGPIARDKVWFFGAMRWWRLDQFQVGARNADGSQAIDDNRIRNFVGKVTWQTRPSIKTSLTFNRNLKDRFHRRDSPYLFVEDRATTLQDQPAQNYSAQYNHVLGQRLVVDARFGRMWGTTPSRYQAEVQPTDISTRDVVRFTITNAAIQQSLNPNDRYQGNATGSYFVDSASFGTHDLKAGVQLSWEGMQYERIRNGDYYLELRDGVPSQAQLSNTPIDSDHRLQTWGVFLQDRWIKGRVTVNVGLRLDGVSAHLPAQSSPAGNFVGERSFPEADVFEFGPDIAPRLGFTYDLFGNGQTAIKAYYGRFYNQFGSEIAEAANPNALVNQPVAWSDRNGNFALDAGELGTFTGFPAGLFPTVDSEATRPYSDEINVGVEQQLANNFALGVSYHRRQHRDGLVILDRARTADAYTPEERTFTNADGSVNAITIYRLKPEFATVRDRYISNVSFLESDYNGVQFDIQKRMSDRWQMLAGLSLQKHRGFEHSGTYTNPSENRDFSNPNTVINRDNGSVFTELPWTFTLSGSYMTRFWDIMLSGKYTARAGDPLTRTFNFTGLTASQVSEVIRVQPRGEDRTEDVTKFVDLRVGKRFEVGGASFEGSVDLFNVLNANHVLLQTEALGTTWGRPTRILAPRIVRLGLTARF